MRIKSRDQFEKGQEVYVLGSRDTLLPGEIVQKEGLVWLVKVSGRTFRIGESEIILREEETSNEA